MTVLITAGAGYVGSHALQVLQASGTPCVVLDNLSRGQGSQLRQLLLRRPPGLDRLLR
jgi:UDP-glucose 4-epimerase